jgi:hypothetical protein
MLVYLPGDGCVVVVAVALSFVGVTMLVFESLSPRPYLQD